MDVKGVCRSRSAVKLQRNPPVAVRGYKITARHILNIQHDINLIGLRRRVRRYGEHRIRRFRYRGGAGAHHGQRRNVIIQKINRYRLFNNRYRYGINRYRPCHTGNRVVLTSHCRKSYRQRPVHLIHGVIFYFNRVSRPRSAANRSEVQARCLRTRLSRCKETARLTDIQRHLKGSYRHNA